MCKLVRRYSWLNARTLSIRPVHFSIIAVMAVMGGRSAYAVSSPRQTQLSIYLLITRKTDIVAVQRVYYKQTYGFLYQWMLVLSTQLIGFSIGGICRRFLVSPPSMSTHALPFLRVQILRLRFTPVWPSNLVLCALFNTLHSQEYVGMGRRDGWSREKFFMVALAAGTVYCQWHPHTFQSERRY